MYGAPLMLSMPPATTMSASPSAIDCAASATALSPEPHALLIVYPGTSFGIPALRYATRAGFRPRPAVSTLPRITSSTWSPGRPPARRSASRMTIAPSSGAGVCASAPPSVPIAVLVAPTMTAFFIRASSRRVHAKAGVQLLHPATRRSNRRARGSESANALLDGTFAEERAQTFRQTRRRFCKRGAVLRLRVAVRYVDFSRGPTLLNTPYVSSEGSPNRAATPLAERRGGDRRDLLALGSLIVLACALRLPGLASRSLWVDEAWRANVALASSWSGFWNDVLGSGRIEAPMPPLYALALRLIGMVVGHSAGGLRASSLAASVAAIPLAYVLGRHARGPVAGIAAAMAFACYPAAVTYGRELKPYAFDVLVVLAVLVCAARTIARRDRASWILLAAMTALAPGLSYPAILVLPGVALGLLATCRDRRDFRRWLATEVFATLSLLVWYVLVIAVQRQRPGVVAYWGGAFPSFTASGATAVLAAGTELIEFAAGTPAWLFALAVALGFFSTPRWLRLATLGTVTTVVVVGFLRMYPLSGGRTSLFLLPFIYVALAVAAAALIPAARGEARTASHGRRLATVSRVLAAMAAVVVLALPLRGASHPDAGLVYEETAPLISWLTAERKPD